MAGNGRPWLAGYSHSGGIRWQRPGFGRGCEHCRAHGQETIFGAPGFHHLGGADRSARWRQGAEISLATAIGWWYGRGPGPDGGAWRLGFEQSNLRRRTRRRHDNPERWKDLCHGCGHGRCIASVRGSGRCAGTGIAGNISPAVSCIAARSGDRRDPAQPCRGSEWC